MKSKTLSLFIISLIFLGCLKNESKKKSLSSSPTIYLCDKEAILKNGILKTIIYYEDSLNQKKELGYELFDSLGNLIFQMSSYEYSKFEFDSLGRPSKKEFITDYVAPYSIKYKYIPKERKLLQIWFHTHLPLEKIDSNKIPQSDTSILLFSPKNLLKFETGYLHEDLGIKSVSYQKEYEYDTLNRVIKITSYYFNLEEKFRYMTVNHNSWEIVMLSSNPKIEEIYKYQNNQLIEKESQYIDLNKKKEISTIKTLYDSNGLKKETFNLSHQSSLKYFHSKYDTTLLENKK